MRPQLLAKVIASRERLGRETVRRWIVQAEVDGGIRPGVASSEHAEIKALKAQQRFQMCVCYPETASECS